VRLEQESQVVRLEVVELQSHEGSSETARRHEGGGVRGTSTPRGFAWNRTSPAPASRSACFNPTGSSETIWAFSLGSC